MRLRTFYSTIVLSDIHLGTSHSKTVEVSNFLKSVNCRRLILNGDIIDGWADAEHPSGDAGRMYRAAAQRYHEDDGKAGNRSDLCSWQPR